MSYLLSFLWRQQVILGLRLQPELNILGTAQGEGKEPCQWCYWQSGEHLLAQTSGSWAFNKNFMFNKNFVKRFLWIEMLHWFFISFLATCLQRKKSKALQPDCTSGNSGRAKYTVAAGDWYKLMRDQGPLSRATPYLPLFSFLAGNQPTAACWL